MKLLSSVCRLTGKSLYVAIVLAGAVFIPGMVALSFSLLGFELDWGTWKTYVGILLISFGLLAT